MVHIMYSESLNYVLFTNCTQPRRQIYRVECWGGISCRAYYFFLGWMITTKPPWGYITFQNINIKIIFYFLRCKNRRTTFVMLFPAMTRGKVDIFRHLRWSENCAKLTASSWDMYCWKNPHRKKEDETYEQKMTKPYLQT